MDENVFEIDMYGNVNCSRNQFKTDKKFVTIIKSQDVQQILNKYKANDIHCLYDEYHRKFMMYAPLIGVKKIWEDGYVEKLDVFKAEMKNLIVELDEKTDIGFELDSVLNKGELHIVYSIEEIIPWINNEFSHNKWYFRKTGKDWDIYKFLKAGRKYFIFGDIYVY